MTNKDGPASLRGKSKDQLMAEVIGLRRRIAELESAPAEHSHMRAKPEQEHRVLENGIEPTRTGSIKDDRGIESDIFKQTEIERDPKNSEEMLRSLISAITESAFVMNPDGVVLITNETTARRLGTSRAGLIGKSVYDFLPPQVAESRQAQVEQVIRFGRPVQFEDSRLGRDFVSSIYPLFDAGGSVNRLAVFGLDITARNQAEEAYRALVDQSLQGLIIIQAGRIVFANQSFAEIGGYTVVEELYALSPEELQVLVHPDDQAYVWDRFRDRLAGKEVPARYECRGIRKDSTILWLEMYASRIEYRGKPAIQAAIIDVTERKETEKALRETLNRTEALYHVSRALIGPEKLSELLQKITDSVAEALDVDRVTLYTFDLDRRQVTDVVDGGPGAVGDRIPFDELMAGLTGWVIRESKPALSPGNEPDPRESRVVQARRARLGCGDIIVVPLQYRDRILGTMTAVNRPEQRSLTREDVSLMMAMGHQAAVAIENARLREQARQDAEARAMLLREVNHRVKNNLSAIIGLLYAERRHAGLRDDATYQAVIRDLINRVKGLATVHDLLSAANWQPLRLSDLTDQLIEAVLQSLPRGKRVTVEVCPSPVEVTAKQANSLALAINELATNTVKYALADRNMARIRVNIACEGGATIRFEYRDDGPGYPAEVLQLQRHNVGLYLVRNLVRDGLRGELSLRNDEGAVTVIRFRHAGVEAAADHNDG